MAATFGKVIDNLKAQKQEIDEKISVQTAATSALRRQLADAESSGESMRRYSDELDAAIRLLDGAFDPKETE